MKRIIKKIFLSLLLMALFIFVFAVLENNPRSVVGLLMKEELLPATAVNFEIKLFGFLPVGDVVVEDKGIATFRGEDVYHIALIAKSKEIISKVIRAEMKISSYVDPASLLPVYYKESMKTSAKGEDRKEIFYNQYRNVMVTRGERIKILPDTLGPLSAFNYIRQLDFENERYFDLNINSNRKNYIFRGEVDEINYRIKDKNVRVWKLTGNIIRRDKDPLHSSRVKVWILDNKSRTPIFVKVASNRIFYSARVSHIK